MFTRILLAVLLVAAPLNALSGKSKGREDYPSLSAARPEPPAGYAFRVVRLAHCAVEARWQPALQQLYVSQTLVFSNLEHFEAPLRLLLSFDSYRITLDSLRWSLGVDSTRVDGKGMLVFAGPGTAGAVDTLRLFFRSGRDGLNALDNLRYPPGERYDALGYWLAAPEYAQGLWTSELTASAPEGLTVVSVGERLDSTQAADGMVTHKWRVTYPWAGVQTLEIGRFDTFELDSAGFKVRLLHHGHPDSLVHNFAQWTLQALSSYTEWFGPPPYRDISLVDVPDIGGTAFSTPGALYLNSDMLDNPSVGGSGTFFTRKIVAHEVAHQWWGGLVQSIEHRPMLEAFSEYCAINAVYEAPEDARLFLRRYLQSGIRDAAGSDYDKSLLDSESGMFYGKGPWVVQMLEEVVGREAFRSALKGFLSGFSFRDATLDDLFAALGKVYSGDLAWFRREWFERAGYPALKITRGIKREGEQWQLTVALRQSGEPFRIPLEMKVFLPGGGDILRTIQLTGPADTLRLSLDLRPDSVLADPDNKTLVDCLWAAQADIFPIEYVPELSGGYGVDFYLDSTIVYKRIKLFHDCRGEGRWDSLAIEPDSLHSGYGRALLPPAAPGREVRFWFSYADESGFECRFPAGAPEHSLFHFRITQALPADSRQGYVTFDDWSNASFDTTMNAFTGKFQGLAGFDLQTLQPLGILYGVGMLAPEYDRKRRLLITLNNGLGTLDVVDLAAWRLKKRVPLPTGFECGSPLSALDRKDGIYYLLGTQLLELNLETGEIKVLIEKVIQGSGLSLEYNESAGMLAVKEGNRLHLFNGADGSLRGEYPFPDWQLPHLLDNNQLVSLEWVSEPVPRQPAQATGRHWLVARWYSLSPGPVRVDSLVSPLLEEGYGLITELFDTDDFLFLDSQKKVLVHKSLTMGSLDKIYLWDYSGARDTLSEFQLSQSYLPYSSRFGLLDDRGDIGALTVRGLSNLTKISLCGKPEIGIQYYSPFSGRQDSRMFMDLGVIRGLALPEIESLGDINSDGGTDVEDLIDLLGVLKNGTGASHTMYDMNYDGRVDVFDLLVLLKRMSRR